MRMNFVCSCLMGVEGLVANELHDMGAENVMAENGRVLFSGDMNTMARANIRVRYGERILILLGRFKATSFTELFEGVKALDFSRYIGIKDAFPVKGSCVKSKLASVPDCQSIIKKAVVESLKKSCNVEWFEETGAVHRISFLILKDEVSIMLDTTGDPLYKRGYRRVSTVAPIRETLAAAMVKLSHVRYNSTLIDPFCGSGTILIEGCMYEMNIAPGLRRSFVCEDWNIVPKKAFQEERERAFSEIRRDSQFIAKGFDIDEKALEIAERNAECAGVKSKIVLEKRDIRDFKIEDDFASVICNPPYGERLLDKQKARELYKIMGEKFIKKAGLNYYIISSDNEFENYYGKVADKRRKLYNGMIKCYYHMYFRNQHK